MSLSWWLGIGGWVGEDGRGRKKRRREGTMSRRKVRNWRSRRKNTMMIPTKRARVLLYLAESRAKTGRHWKEAAMRSMASSRRMKMKKRRPGTDG
jgi:hypothetical protein